MYELNIKIWYIHTVLCYNNEEIELLICRFFTIFLKFWVIFSKYLMDVLYSIHNNSVKLNIKIILYMLI